MIAIEVLLDKLGAMTSDDIAAYFQEEGLKARSGNFSCAVAVFMRGHGHDVNVGRTSMRVRTEENPFLTFTLPESVQQFIYSYDLHKYPFLEETGL